MRVLSRSFGSDPPAFHATLSPTQRELRLTLSIVLFASFTFSSSAASTPKGSSVKQYRKVLKNIAARVGVHDVLGVGVRRAGRARKSVEELSNSCDRNTRPRRQQRERRRREACGGECTKVSVGLDGELAQQTPAGDLDLTLRHRPPAGACRCPSSNPSSMRLGLDLLNLLMIFHSH